MEKKRTSALTGEIEIQSEPFKKVVGKNSIISVDNNVFSCCIQYEYPRYGFPLFATHGSFINGKLPPSNPGYETYVWGEGADQKPVVVAITLEVTEYVPSNVTTTLYPPAWTINAKMIIPRTIPIDVKIVATTDTPQQFLWQGGLTDYAEAASILTATGSIDGKEVVLKGVGYCESVGFENPALVTDPKLQRTRAIQTAKLPDAVYHEQAPKAFPICKKPSLPARGFLISYLDIVGAPSWDFVNTPFVFHFQSAAIMHFQFLLLGASLLFSTTQASIHHDFKHKRENDLTTATVTDPGSTSIVELSSISPAISSDAATTTEAAAASSTDLSLAVSTTVAIDSTSTESTPLFQSHPLTTSTAIIPSNSSLSTSSPTTKEASTSASEKTAGASTKTEQTTVIPTGIPTTSGAVATSTPKSAAGKTLDARGWCVVLSIVFGAWGVVGLMFGLGVGGWI
ncbi:hypothetical protein BDZ45DRAFT_799752 [Acephala macrosclerotiorum]|nr:hypothetical protein BDZ45DRAFT_799752 [Acephala macrosclerotiorum]